MVNFISELMIPLLVLFIVIYAIIKKINVYDAFVEGSTESFQMILTIFPCILAMIFAINIFLESGLLTGVLELIRPVLSMLKVPVEIIPMALMRPISGNATLAILNNLLSDFGPDSLIGRIGSVIQGSTETTFYVLTLYFGSVGIKKIRHAMWTGLTVDLIGIISSIIIVLLFFGP
ncbi:MAG: spore maturation protein [Bacilli bacterium]|nr:spore maturation protein [Bacilli bacterium]MDD4547180.1 spore maturation protein [Bacilli bacterium]